MGIKQGVVGGLVATVMLLAGCEGVGDGSAPDPGKANLQKLVGTKALGENKLYTCVAQLMQYTIGYTNDQGDEDFTNRARWTSLNRDVAIVTNRGDRVPGEFDANGDPLFYQFSGMILPKQAGTVTIEADAFGIKKSVTFTVSDPTSLRIDPVGYTIPDVTAIKVTQKSLQPLQMVATLEGLDVGIDSSLKGFVFDDPDDTVAKIQQDSSSGLFTVVPNETDKTGTLKARPQFIACDDTHPLVKDLAIDVTVKAADSLVVKREFDAPADNVLALDTNASPQLTSTEILRVFATFDGGAAEQEVSGQVIGLSSNAAVLLPLAFGQTTGLLALSTGTDSPPESAPVTVKYCIQKPKPADAPADYVRECFSPETAPESFVVRKATLQSIAVTPVDGVIPALDRLQYRAVATFAGGRQQDITRHVVWERDTAKADKLSIGTGTIQAGLAQSRKLVNTDTDAANGTPLEDRQVKIKASIKNTSTTTLSQEVTATISQ